MTDYIIEVRSVDLDEAKVNIKERKHTNFDLTKQCLVIKHSLHMLYISELHLSYSFVLSCDKGFCFIIRSDSMSNNLCLSTWQWCVFYHTFRLSFYLRLVLVCKEEFEALRIECLNCHHLFRQYVIGLTFLECLFCDLLTIYDQ